MPELHLSGDAICLIDEEDYAWVSRYRWHRMGGGNCAYAGRAVVVDGKRTTVYLHRLIAKAPPYLHVDHINGNGLDNRRANLRLVTHAQNHQNKRSARIDSTTGERGVERHRKSFRAVVMVNGKRFRGASFLTVAEAAADARQMRRRLMTHSPECLEAL